MNRRLDFYSKIDDVVVDLNDYYSGTLRDGTSLKDKTDNIEKLAERQKDGELDLSSDIYKV